MSISVSENKSIIDIMSVLTKSGKFIGKGGNIVIANIKDKTKMLRLSSDIDCTACDFSSSDDILDFVKKLFPDKEVFKSRESGEKRTLQIMIDKIPIDIETNNRYYYNIETYNLYGVEIVGCSIYDVLVDKIAVLSSRKIFRRSKDLIDIYNIITNYYIDSNIFIDTYNKSGNQFENFEQFCNQKDNLKHAYDTLELGEGSIKEDFEIVYDTVNRFRIGIMSKCTWDYNIRDWVTYNTGKNILSHIESANYNIANKILEDN